MAKKFIPMVAMFALLVLLLSGLPLRQTEASPDTWVQTTRAEFEFGVLSNVDTSSSPDNVKLATVSDWYNTSWAYRKKITVTTGANSPYSDYNGYTVQITVDTTDSTRFRADCNDLRILYWTGSAWSELDRHIINPGTLSTDVRFQLQANIAASSFDDNYYMYYNNPSATAGPANLSNVYLWFDDASTNRYAEYTKGRGDNWHGSGGTNSFAWNAAGYYTYDTGNNFTNSFRIPNATLSERDAYIEVEFYHTNAYLTDMTSGVLGRYILAGGSGASESADHYYATNRADSPYQGSTGYAHDVSIMKTSRGTVAIGPADGSAAPVITGSQWRKQAMAIWGINPTNGKFWDNDIAANMGPPGWPSQAATKSGTDATDYEGAGEWGLIVAQDAARVRHILVRRYTEPEPSTGLGGEEGVYVSLGTIASQVLDTGAAAVWDELSWSETLQTNTDITFEVRASDTLFAKDAATPSWISVGGASPVTSGLPSGQYMQWRATLSTTDTSQTPVLHDVTINYSHPAKTAVGGTVYPINKAAILMPWFGLALVLILALGGGALILRRQRT